VFQQNIQLQDIVYQLIEAQDKLSNIATAELANLSGASKVKLNELRLETEGNLLQYRI
jgi:hypothetical protein